jgi:hypothetical protein
VSLVGVMVWFLEVASMARLGRYFGVVLIDFPLCAIYSMLPDGGMPWICLLYSALVTSLQFVLRLKLRGKVILDIHTA